MKQVFLIAVNFVREQRWPIFVLMLWVLLLAFLGLFTDIRQKDDLLFIFKLVAVYVVVFSIFFGGAAIYSERKSRRILAVISKGVGRAQYLTGLVLGVTMACTIYCFSLGLTASWALGQGGFSVAQIWFLMACLVAACILSGTVALMFSTFLNPFFAAGATAVVLGFPAVAGHVFSGQWDYLVPVSMLVQMVMNSSFHSPENMHWFPLAWALVEAVFFWVVAARIFARVDIAVAVE